jgi:predicted transposase YdaD
MFESQELKQIKVDREAFKQGYKEGFKEEFKRGFKEGYQEGKLTVVPVLLKAGIKVEEIARQLSLDLNALRQIASQQQPD